MIVGIDPGSVHCGLCYLRDDGTCALCTEVTPGGLFQALEDLPQGTGLVVAYEGFHLYSWAAKHKIHSSFPEVETIGVLKYIANKKGWRCIEVLPANHKIHKYPERFESSHAYDAYSAAMYVYRFKQG